MDWRILITISVVLYSVSTLLQRVLMRDQENHPIAFAMLYQLLVAAGFAILTFALGKVQLPPILPLIPNLVLTMILFGAANIFIFKSLAHTDASQFTIVFASRFFFTVLASSLLLREALSWLQLTGALIIFIGVALASARHHFTFQKGEWYALLAAMFFGFALTNDRYLLQSFNVYAYSVIAFALPAFFIAAIRPREVPNLMRYLKGPLLIKTLAISLCYLLFTITFYLALQATDNSSQVAAVSITSVLLTVLLAIIFLKERENIGRKILSAGICLIGILLLL